MTIQRVVDKWFKQDKGQKDLALQAGESRYDTNNLWMIRKTCGRHSWSWMGSWLWVEKAKRVTSSGLMIRYEELND